MSRSIALTASRSWSARAWRVVAGGEGGSGWDDETQADLFVAWLRTTTRPRLVVLDDVDEPADLRVGSVVTTRRRDAAVIRSSARIVPVGTFAPRGGRRLPPLTAHGGRRRDDTRELHAPADRLGHFPLALPQAAAFLIDTGMPLTAGQALIPPHATPATPSERVTVADYLIRIPPSPAPCSARTAAEREVLHSARSATDRTAGPVDLLVAAAEEAGLTPLPHDRDFETVARTVCAGCCDPNAR
ncbi:hypothetical protein [Streptomyces longisporus]|uniref:hypothetical protein n=1 Tax=Streptomyces longisporus TaxID=1948 RepID=UPI0031D06AC5